MTVADVALGRFEMGRVATRTFEVIRANFAPFFFLGVIATIPTTVYAVLVTVGTLPATVVSGSNAHLVGLYLMGAGASAVVGAFFSLILQATLTYGSIAYLSDQPVTLPRALGVGVRQFLPLLGIGILEGLGLIGGFLLLVVPGFMLFAMWMMVVPARIAENTGIIESFSRSRALTAGYRWPIFGCIVVLGLGSGIAQSAVRPLIAVSATGAIPATAYIGVLLTAAVTAIVAVASATLHASIYYELRMIKEGVGPAQIAAIFD